MPKDFILDLSNVPDYQIDQGKELPKEMLNQLLLPPNPYAHPKSERARWFRKRDLWFSRRRRYEVKGWPELLAAFGARFDRRKAAWRRQEREVDKELSRLRAQGYSKTEIKDWAEAHLLSFEEFNQAVKKFIEKYRKHLEGKHVKPVKFFKKGK